MLRRLLGLVEYWWSADRIRVSPSEGRLLRLGPGAVLLLCGEAVQVTGRRADDAGVTYRCTSATGDGEVRVEVANTVVVVRIGGEPRTLGEHQVEVIPGPACSRPFNF